MIGIDHSNRSSMFFLQTIDAMGPHTVRNRECIDFSMITCMFTGSSVSFWGWFAKSCGGSTERRKMTLDGHAALIFGPVELYKPSNQVL